MLIERYLENDYQFLKHWEKANKELWKQVFSFKFILGSHNVLGQQII